MNTMIMRQQFAQPDPPFHRSARRFALTGEWLAEESPPTLRLRIFERRPANSEFPRLNTLRLTAARARAVRIELAYALAAAEGSPLVVVGGETFALAEAESFEAVLGDALAGLPS